jgi:hypothetical protein
MSTELEKLLDANLSLYTAFESLTMSEMSRVWAQRPEDRCIHPGWDILSGWREIRESWRAIFASTEFVRVEVTEVSAEIIGSVGRVVCVESLLSVIDGQAVHSRVAATNLFIQTDAGWRLTLHHGSPIASEPVMVGEVDTDVN